MERRDEGPNGMRKRSAIFTASRIFHCAEENILGGRFQLGRKGMEIEAFLLLSPRRICLRLILHGCEDHGFGCDVGALDCDNSDCYRIIIHCEKARKEEWATNVAQYSKNTE